MSENSCVSIFLQTFQYRSIAFSIYWTSYIVLINFTKGSFYKFYENPTPLVTNLANVGELWELWSKRGFVRKNFGLSCHCRRLFPSILKLELRKLFIKNW